MEEEEEEVVAAAGGREEEMERDEKGRVGQEKYCAYGSVANMEIKDTGTG